MVQPARQIGRWNLGRRLGKGGQGSVFHATPAEGGEVFALKRIRARTAKKLARFEREIQQHKALSDRRAPNVMPLLEHHIERHPDGTAEGYIVMPLAVGTLEDSVATFERRVELSLEVFLGIVRGVSEAHAVGVIHRDLKPANILFLDRALSEPYVSDFGICLLKSAEDRITGIDETVGAKWFMAPEQERGGVVDVTESADVYALGKLLAYMLTGRYNAIYREEIEACFTTDEVADDPRLALIRDELIARTVLREPSERLQTAAELLDLASQLLFRFRGSIPPAIPPTVALPPITKQDMDGNGNGSSGTALRQAYNRAVLSLAEGRSRLTKLEFDSACQRFAYSWDALRPRIEHDPKLAGHAAEALLQDQPESIGATLAMARFDAAELLIDFKHFIEYVMNSTEDVAGDRRIRSIPHVCAGFHYMLAAVAALQREAWVTLDFLLTVKFAWYYQSTRPLFSYAFDLPYFFYPEALERQATSAHDFYRAQLARTEVAQLLAIRESELPSLYVQVQFLMCVRAAQLNELGEEVNLFADFGRFYGERLQSLLFRIENDEAFASGVLKSFGEDRRTWFGNLPVRLAEIQRTFWDGARFDWASISRWPED
jgi:serine/threonine protein kinase